MILRLSLTWETVNRGLLFETMQGSVQYMADLRKKLTSPPKQGSVSKGKQEKEKANELEKTRLNDVVRAKTREITKLVDAKKIVAAKEKKLAEEVNCLEKKVSTP
ncbi:hypothetical protein P8452_31353 [Trifolium repens]|nr:hypothetical protein P8452_31353 [Trifolium repens]